jgi:hypothetical protein
MYTFFEFAGHAFTRRAVGVLFIGVFNRVLLTAKLLISPRLVWVGGAEFAKWAMLVPELHCAVH